MAVFAYWLASGPATGAGIQGDYRAFYFADAFADLPTTNVREGERAYADSVHYCWDGSAWIGAIAIENRTSDPVSPVTGQLWLRTDL